MQFIQEVAALGEPGLALLMDFLLAQQREGNLDAIDLINGKIYQSLFQAGTPATQEFLQQHFPTGVIPLRSERTVNYDSLQVLLAQQDFQSADRLTLEKMCELSGDAAVRRKWLYFTEVQSLPVDDLKLINSLWLLHSEGRFGFSVQREIWMGVGRDWERLWTKIGWRTNGNWTRYPQEFVWNATAPRGHLPLTNQLRGVRMMEMLMTHPAWDNS